jgi:hypothetical protein
MRVFHILEPEVAGDWGDNTKFTRTPGTPTVIHRLHYEFNGWLGDCLLATSPCFIVTVAAANAMAKAGLSGFSTDNVEITTSADFEQLCPNVVLPEFLWLKVSGHPGADDFGMTSNLDLVVSEQALKILETQGISNALIESFNDCHT